MAAGIKLDVTTAFGASFLDDFLAVLAGTPSNDGTDFTITGTAEKLVATGAFTFTPGPEPTDGSVFDGVQVFGGKDLDMLEYAFSDLTFTEGDLEAAAGAGKAAIFSLLFSGDDTLNGAGASDYLSGGKGKDIINGGGNDDHLMGGKGKDTIDGGAGTGDEVNYSDKGKSQGISVKLDAENFVAVKVHGKVEDHVANCEVVIGGKGKDHLTGDALDNVFDGGGGKDVLKGGGGSDQFAFRSGGQADAIRDFDTVLDSILLSKDLFTVAAAAIVSNGALTNANFSGSGGPLDNDDFFYLQHHSLKYDSNGSDAGGTKMIIAVLKPGAALVADDILFFHF